MPTRILTAAFLALLSFSPVAANQPTCSLSQKCPESAPCCSAYGQCGVGAYCLGGCDPRSSFSLKSCMPMPVCKSADYKLSSLNDIAPITEYLGDADKVNWVSSGKPVVFNDKILLTMAPDTVGTLLASTRYMWYGKVSATMTTSRGQGVVTAFILMSNAKDEIDYEFVGSDVDNAQSNYYSLGVTDYTKSENISTTNTYETVHTYTLDWTPDAITWSIDGEERRVVKRSDTWNETTSQHNYPQTPSQIMISLWPAGLPSNAEGTINWAGGVIDWNSPYMQNGYYYAMVSDVKVECYDPPANAKKTGSKSYIYTDESASESSIEITDEDSVLASLKATGENPDFNPNASKVTSAAASKSSSPSAKSGLPEPEPEPESVPGITGAGERGENAQIFGGSASGDNENGDSGGPGSPDGERTGTESTGFSQGSGSTGNSNAAIKERPAGSVFAVIIAVLGLLVL